MTKDQLFSGESKNIEYKVTVPDKSEKYMKTVVAFANGRGGRIVFGIDDKTLNIVGIDTEEVSSVLVYVVFSYRGLVKWYDRGLQNLWWEFDSLIPC